MLRVIRGHGETGSPVGLALKHVQAELARVEKSGVKTAKKSASRSVASVKKAVRRVLPKKQVAKKVLTKSKKKN